MASAHAAHFAGLPAPRPGEFTLYVFGPGYGESQVLALPDGKWVVVDCCIMEDIILPLELLRHFGATSVDLLVVTHPDLDHYKGLPEFIQGIPVRRLWRYPGFQTLRELLILLEQQEPEPRVTEMLRAHESMAKLMRSPQGEEGYYGLFWAPQGAPYEVYCLAPSSREKATTFEALPELIRRLKRGEKISAQDKRRFMERGNLLSLALSLRWNDRKSGLLLGGDVERESGEEHGWRGVLANLKEDNDLKNRGLWLLQGLRLVKASHHGSAGAFCAEAWEQFSTPAPVETVVVTPFNRGSNPPPRTSGLVPLLRFARQLALTSEPPQGWSVATDAGWVRITRPSGPGAAACVAVALKDEPPSEINLSLQAGLFQPGAPAGG
jgi:hypothetical protein